MRTSSKVLMRNEVHQRVKEALEAYIISRHHVSEKYLHENINLCTYGKQPSFSENAASVIVSNYNYIQHIIISNII